MAAVPSGQKSYAGGLGAQYRQRQGRIFGKPPGIRIHPRRHETVVISNTFLAAWGGCLVDAGVQRKPVDSASPVSTTTHGTPPMTLSFAPERIEM